MIPQGFIDEMRSQLGADEADALVSALLTEPVTGIRLNPAKPAPLPASLQGEPVPWCADGRILPSRPLFTLMPELHAGAFYVQDPSSMSHRHIVERIVDLAGWQNRRLVVLDACAAPGGKTTAVLDALPAGSLMVANEFVPARANVLAENVAKWGNPDVVVTSADTAAFRKAGVAFDIIVLDAPCSGEGMMRKDEEARRQWSPGLVEQCARLQREIIDNVAPLLRPGGFLIYSTCTFNRHEDEDNLQYARDTYGLLPVDMPLGHHGRFMPHRVQGEGLFVGVLRAPDDYPAVSRSKVRTKTKPVKFPLDRYLSDASRYQVVDLNNRLYTWPMQHADAIRSIYDNVHTVLPGLELGEFKRTDFIPSHYLALTTALRPDAFPRVDLDLDSALAYLRKEEVRLADATVPRGHVLVTYAGLPLGFIKNLGNRTNNLYPAPWRIRLQK